MPTILLIRHGENEYVAKGRLAGRLEGVHLNDNGHTQAEALADALVKTPITIKAIYSSPLERTVETAQPIAQALGLDVTIRPGLLEVDFGEWENKTIKQLRHRKLWSVVQQTPSLMRFPHGESFVEAQTRIIGEIEALIALHKPKDVFICVTHSDSIKLAVAYYLGLPLDMFQRLTVAPASISTLHLSEKRIQVININHIPMIDHHFPKHKTEADP